jgi:ABC-type lipoprotein release transport system permease subunit
MNGALSGIRGVILGVGLGVLAAKKAGSLTKKADSLLKGALLKYVASHATDQVASTDQAARGSPAT